MITYHYTINTLYMKHLSQTGKATERWVTLIEVSSESEALTHSLWYFIITSLIGSIDDLAKQNLKRGLLQKGIALCVEKLRAITELST